MEQVIGFLFFAGFLVLLIARLSETRINRYLARRIIRRYVGSLTPKQRAALTAYLSIPGAADDPAGIPELYAAYGEKLVKRVTSGFAFAGISANIPTEAFKGEARRILGVSA